MICERDLFLRYVAQTSSDPLMLEVESAEGIYINTTDGKKYIDLISGISVSNLGHRHPAIISAVKDQLDKYSHTMVYGEYVQSSQVQLAKLLTTHLPENLQSVYFVNSGSEAVEGALKLAKKFTGRNQIVSFENAYHGSTHGALSVMGNESLKQNFRPLLPGIKILPYGNQEALAEIGHDTACVIVEPVQGEAGVVIPPTGYLATIRDRCNVTGTLLILDEIQTGLGRTGNLFAFEKEELAPDILLLAKALGGGLPLGAFISSAEIMSILSFNPALGHITTFGGNPVCCAAGLASLQTILLDGFLERVWDVAAIFQEDLRHPEIIQVRQSGLLIAIEFESAEFCKKVIKQCLLLGLITDWFLFNDKCLRIAPPLVINSNEAHLAAGLIIEAINHS